MTKIPQPMQPDDFRANKGNLVYNVLPYNFVISPEESISPVVTITEVRIKACGARQATFENYMGMSKKSVFFKNWHQPCNSAYFLTQDDAIAYTLAKYGKVKLIRRRAFMSDWEAYEKDIPTELN